MSCTHVIMYLLLMHVHSCQMCPFYAAYRTGDAATEREVLPYPECIHMNKMIVLHLFHEAC